MPAELDEVELEFGHDNTRIANWTSYSYSQNWLDPTDTFRFDLGDERIPDELLQRLTTGQEVALRLNGHVQSKGFIDAVETSSSRSGTMVSISGRDKLSPAVDGVVDPHVRLSETQTHEEFLIAVLGPYGFDNPDRFIISGLENVAVQTGSKVGVKTSKKGKPLKSALAHQLKPYPHEGAYQFAERVMSRQGKHIRMSADSLFLVVSEPEFDQAPSYKIVNRRGAAGTGNTPTRVTVRTDATEQPSVIIATGRGGGGDVDHAGLIVIMVNEFVGTYSTGQILPPIQAIIDKYTHARVVPLRQQLLKKAPYLPAYTVHRPLWLHDEQSFTLEQLEFFVRKEMARRMRRGFVYRCTVPGHTQGVHPWCCDTIVAVDDDFAGVHEHLWVLSREFTKSRGEGTTTQLELIRPHTLDLVGDNA